MGNAPTTGMRPRCMPVSHPPTGQENYRPGGPPPMMNMTEPSTNFPGSAIFATKDPVTTLNEYEVQVTYMECPTQNELVCMIVEARGKQFDGYAMTKKEAKEKAAEKALKYLHNIVCHEGIKGEENTSENVEKDSVANNDSENYVSQPSRSRGASIRNRGRGIANRRGRGAFLQSRSMDNLGMQNDSDNQSISSETSRRSRGGGRYQRGGRGRGRGGRGALSEKSSHRSQEEIDGHGEKTQHDNTEFADDADDSFSEAKVFRYLVRTLGGNVSLLEFKEKFSPLPENFDEWIREPKNRLSVFKSGDKPVAVGPFLKDATMCADHMGFGGKKNCQRKDCNHFHICNFYLNGWCKHGFKCRKGHTFTKGHNRE
uniref:Uncharacterized protein LOC111136293 n=1 Tax=Crassostrea virginica TaxID=6565 RepID=A0A8B8ES22_CRAVI|nr:uncharacterized protein LOC111136293 [Crassostrea virginica]